MIFDQEAYNQYIEDMDWEEDVIEEENNPEKKDKKFDNSKSLITVKEFEESKKAEVYMNEEIQTDPSIDITRRYQDELAKMMEDQK